MELIFILSVNVILATLIFIQNIFPQSMESDNAQMKIEIDHLRDLVANARDKGERDKEALKKATRYCFYFYFMLLHQ